MRRWITITAALLCAAALAGCNRSRRSTPAGQTIRIVVGAGAGGGHDREARRLAAHLARHLPGTSSVIVQDLPGAGGLVAANTLLQPASADGATIGYLPLGVLVAQLTGRTPDGFDLRRFVMLGSAYRDRAVCVFPPGSPIRTLADWRASRRALTLGSTGPGSIMHLFPALLARALHLPLRIIDGYKGTAEIRVALAGGELDGACTSLGALDSAWPDRALLAIVIQGGVDPHPDLPEVPVAASLAPAGQWRTLLGPVLDDFESAERTYVLPPGIAPARQRQLQQAIADTMRDPAYVAEASAAGLLVDPVPGRVLADRMKQFFTLPPAISGTVRQALQ